MSTIQITAISKLTSFLEISRCVFRGENSLNATSGAQIQDVHRRLPRQLHRRIQSHRGNGTQSQTVNPQPFLYKRRCKSCKLPNHGERTQRRKIIFWGMMWFTHVKFWVIVCVFFVKSIINQLQLHNSIIPTRKMRVVGDKKGVLGRPDLKGVVANRAGRRTADSVDEVEILDQSL